MNGQVFASWLFKQAVEIKAKSRQIGSVSQQPLGQAAAVMDMVVVGVVLVLSVIVVVGGVVVVVIWEQRPQMYGQILRHGYSNKPLK